MPVIENYKSELNYDYLLNYDRYRSEIELSEDDFDFLCKIKSVLNDIPSFHTYFLSENIDDVFYSSCYMRDSILMDRKLKSSLNLWNEQCKECIADYSKSSDSMVFCYVNGEYMYSSVYSTCDTFKDFKLLKIDGYSIEEFVLNTLSAYKLKYDHNNSHFFRPYIIFNSSTGEKHELSLSDDSGDKINLELYYDIRVEYSKCFYDSYFEDNKSESYCLDSIDDKTIYCQINDFSVDSGKPLYDELKDLCLQKKSENMCIVLDLRNNQGGYIETALSSIVPLICTDKFDVTDTIWIYKSFAVKKLYSYTSLNGIINRKMYDFEKCESPELYQNYKNEFLSKDLKYEINGYSPYFKDVYILTSCNTGSAADFVVSALSECSAVSIIGENTGGEKYGGQALAVLPNSKLVFSFFPEIYYNEDGTNNSIYGTSPDVYATISSYDYKIRETMFLNGVDPYCLENRLIWDTSLKNTLEIIKRENGSFQ